MAPPLPQVWLVRHGETAWSLSGQHTGRTDIALTPAGEAAARTLGPALAGQDFAQVWSSPSQRARRTAELAGFADLLEVKDDLAEWDYGRYEGVTTRAIQEEHPGWTVFADGCPGGENAADVGTRADRIVAAARALDRTLLIFSSAHLLRVLAARWLGQPPEAGAWFVLGTASLSILGYEHDRSEPVIRHWNQTRPEAVR